MSLLLSQLLGQPEPAHSFPPRRRSPNLVVGGPRCSVLRLWPYQRGSPLREAAAFRRLH